MQDGVRGFGRAIREKERKKRMAWGVQGGVVSEREGGGSGSDWFDCLLTRCEDLARNPFRNVRRLYVYGDRVGLLLRLLVCWLYPPSFVQLAG